MHLRLTLLALAALVCCIAEPLHADVITGAGPGIGPVVKVFEGAMGAEIDAFNAFSPSFAGGVRVAAGDVNGDGLADIISGAGPGGGPQVVAFDGATNAVLRSFFAFAPAFSGGVFVAAGDVNDDGWDDIITGADAGAGPQLNVFSGLNGSSLRSFFAYTPSFAGGVRVAAGDVNNDGVDDVITGAGPGGSTHVKVFDGASNAEVRSFFAFNPAFAGGVFVASGDLDGDGFADIVAGADEGGAPHVNVYSGQTGDLMQSFLAYDLAFTGGVRVAAGDVDGDGLVEIVTGAGPGGGPHVKVFNGQTGALEWETFAYARGFAGGVYVAASPVPEPTGITLAALLGVAVWRRQFTWSLVHRFFSGRQELEALTKRDHC